MFFHLFLNCALEFVDLFEHSFSTAKLVYEFDSSLFTYSRTSGIIV